MIMIKFSVFLLNRFVGAYPTDMQAGYAMVKINFDTHFDDQRSLQFLGTSCAANDGPFDFNGSLGMARRERTICTQPMLNVYLI